LAAPSANRFGCISPTTAAHVAEQLGDAVATILDGGPCQVGIESTVLAPDPTPLILRPGGCPRETLESILGETVAVAQRGERALALGLAAPGLLASHYAPRAPLCLKGSDPWPDDPTVACLAFTGQDLPATVGRHEILSRRGDLSEAAMALFAAMRRLDAQRPGRIIAETVPDTGLGLGINDRLRRAAGLG
jgi:L-threonylcarbamoyladenylate synthase